MGTRSILSMAVALLLVGGAAFAGGSWYEELNQFTVTVRSGGASHQITVQDGDTVGTALALAKVKPQAGKLTSIVSHSVIDANYAPANVTVSGRQTSLETKLTKPATIDIQPGVDAVEAVVTVTEPTGPPETVSELRYVDLPGQAGGTVVTKGARSGEVVSQPTLTAAVAPTRRTDKVVALTFDDGPGPYTAAVLKILRDKGAHATFCVVGRMIPDTPASKADIRQIAADGNALCDHTQNHDEHLDKKPQTIIDKEMDDCLAAIAAAGGPRPIFYRPPGGTINPQIIATANRKNLQELHWSIDTNDWKKPGVDKIIARAVAVEPGSIILMHDGGGDRSETVAALPPVIDLLKAMGYTFVIPQSTLPNAGSAVNAPLPPDQSKAPAATTAPATLPGGATTTLPGDGAGPAPAR